jgi:hypothetical protein
MGAGSSPVRQLSWPGTAARPTAPQQLQLPYNKSPEQQEQVGFINLTVSVYVPAVAWRGSWACQELQRIQLRYSSHSFPATDKPEEQEQVGLIE